MSPEEIAVVSRAKRRIRRSRYAIPLLLFWIVALAWCLRVGNSIKIAEHPMIEQKAARDRKMTYLISSAAIFLSGIVAASLFVASPAERLLVRILEDRKDET